MASYKLRIKREAEREIRRLPRQDIRRIITKIYALADNPRPPGCEKLQGRVGYRIRQGDCRIVYAVDDANQSVHVTKIGHRREVYR